MSLRERPRARDLDWTRVALADHLGDDEARAAGASAEPPCALPAALPCALPCALPGAPLRRWDRLRGATPEPLVAFVAPLERARADLSDGVATWA